jgi:hypothetical protein
MKKVICKIKGGFANQAIQYLFALSLAKKTRRELVLDISDYSFFNILQILKGNTIQKLFIGFKDINYISFRNPFNLSLDMFNDSCKLESILNSSKNNIYLNGYWHSAEYVNFIDEKVKKHFLRLITKYASDRTIEIIEALKNTPDSLSIHVRQGDYLKGKYKDIYVSCSIDYYRECYQKIKANLAEDASIYVLSDNHEWVKKHFSFIKNYVLYDGNGYIDDFIVMMYCNNNVIANSSFSWLSASLNQTKNSKKFAPLNWFKVNNKEALPLDEFTLISNKIY